MTVKMRVYMSNTEINPEIKDLQEITDSVTYSEYNSSYPISDKLNFLLNAKNTYSHGFSHKKNPEPYTYSLFVEDRHVYIW